MLNLNKPILVDFNLTDLRIISMRVDLNQQIAEPVYVKDALSADNLLHPSDRNFNGMRERLGSLMHKCLDPSASLEEIINYIDQNGFPLIAYQMNLRVKVHNI